MAVKKLLIIASTFPASDEDTVPAFVRDQVIALKKLYPELEISILAPHDIRSGTVAFHRWQYYDEYRFHYFWPFRFEKLAGHGIVPALRQNPAYYLLVPFLIGAEFFAVFTLCRKQKPDMLYAHWFTPQGLVVGMVSMLTRIPYAYTSHSSDVAFLHKVPFVGPRLVRIFTARAKAVTVVSNRSLSKLQTFFDASAWRSVRQKVAIIPMGVDAALTEKGNKSEHKRHNNILFIGRLVEKKGVQYLLPAFKAVLQSHPEATLTIAGDGPWMTRLQKQANDLTIPKKHIVFTGYVHGNKKTELIMASDVCVVPSIIADDGDAEGLPVALMEGLAASKVCIATNESGADDVIEDGKSGFLVPEKDAEALATAIKEALSMESGRYMAMQRNAKSVSKQFAWPHIAKQHYEFLFR